VNSVNDEVRPEPPIRGRPHVMLIPGGAFQSGSAAGEFDQAKLPAVGNQKIGQVRRISPMPCVSALRS
jgi:hypothetical protein